MKHNQKITCKIDEMEVNGEFVITNNGERIRYLDDMYNYQHIEINKVKDIKIKKTNALKIITMIEIYTQSKEKIEISTLLEVDYFDDEKKIVWLKTPNSFSCTGEFYINLDCFTNFCKLLTN